METLFSHYALLSNEVLEETCSEHDDLKELSGRARFRVTLIPDKVEPDTLPPAHYYSVQHAPISSISAQVASITEFELEVASEDEITNGVETVASSSRFADAESE